MIATNEDLRALKKFIDNADEEETSLKLDILEFFTDWSINRQGEKDAHYHNAVYNFLVLIGHRPQQQTNNKGERR